MMFRRLLGLAAFGSLVFLAGPLPTGGNAENAPASAASTKGMPSLLDRFDIGMNDIRTIAGGAELPPSQPPRDIALYGISGVAVDRRDGTVYISDSVRHMVFKIDARGTRIEPFAGMQVAGYNGDGRRALDTKFHVPGDLSVDPVTGDVLLADTHNYRIRRIARDGSKVTTVAGMGIRGIVPQKTPLEWPLIGPNGRRDTVVYSGDGGPAIQAELNQPSGVGLDAQGNVYIADTSNHRVRAVNLQKQPITIAGVKIAPGAIATVFGTGQRGFAGDGGPALAAKMDSPRKVRVTQQGDILVVDMLNQRIRKVDHVTGVVDTVAKGTAFPGELPASEVVYFSIDGIDIGSKGEVVYSDLQSNSIYRLDMEKNASTVIAGVGLPGRSANGEEASNARLHGAGAVAVAPSGDVYVVDVWNALLWKLSEGKLTIFAGGGATGDGGPSQLATFGPMAPIEIDPQGNVYLSDMYAHVVRRIRADNGKIERFAGTGAVGYSGDGGSPLQAKLLTIINLSVLGDDIYMADSQIPNIRRVVRRPSGDLIETFAGIPFQWKYESGDEGPALKAQFGLPQNVVRHPKTGEVYISDSWMNNIRRIDAQGVIHHFAGLTGPQGYGGDGGPAPQGRFAWPLAMVFDDEGNLYVVDHFNHRVRVIDTKGVISTFAGTGTRGFNGEGLPAKQSQLDHPIDIARDRAGNIYVADMGNHCVRKIDRTPPHVMSSVAGICNERGFSGDGGPARIAYLNAPRGITIGPDNGLYITDSFNNRVRAVRLEETPR